MDDNSQKPERDAYRASKFTLFHRPQCLGDSIADFDTALFEFLSSSA